MLLILWLIVLVYYNYCIACYKYIKNKYLCRKCYKQIYFYNYCYQGCELDDNYFCKICNIYVYIPFIYTEFISKLILKFKYGENHNCAKFFAREINKKYKNNNWEITPIPISYIKKIWKGFNQTELLAYYLNKKTNYNIFGKIHSINSIGLNKEERIDKSDTLYVKNIPNFPVCILDDVIASGATIKKAISLIKSYNISIGICAIARV